MNGLKRMALIASLATGSLAFASEQGSQVTGGMDRSASLSGAEISWEASETSNFSALMASTVGKTYYVQARKLNARAGDSVTAEKIGTLRRNTEVQVISAGPDAENEMVEVQVVDKDSDLRGQVVFVSEGYLDAKAADVPTASGGKVNYFMIQNIASEKLRVYKRVCEEDSCFNKMVLESDLAVGEKEGGTMTRLGYYKITSWHKFYRDRGGKYPSWYDPKLKYPVVPKGKGVIAWLKSGKYRKYKNGKKAPGPRGAFGWYTAKVGPNPGGQWTHGTVGWGQDKKKFILLTRKGWINALSDPRSHGCSRTDNETIAYVRTLLPVGAPIIKIYAKEAIEEPNMSRYQGHKEASWDYALTSRYLRKEDHDTADAEDNRHVAENLILERGTYTVDQFPNAKEFKSGSEKDDRKGKTANIYGVSSSNMKGVFYVDSGRVENYRHPRGLRVGGYKSGLPSFMVKK